MMRKVTPTIFARSKKQFKNRLKKLLELNRDLQIDFMDGRFVKNKGISVKDVSDLTKYNIRFEAHLMTLNPSLYIKDLKNKGFKRVIFHYEAINDEDKTLGLIFYIHTHGMKALVALNPETDINKIKDILYYADGVLLMGVRPGKENQKFISKVYNKIRKLRKINRKIIIQIDGGVNLKTAEKLRKLKVNAINTGSFVSEAKDSKKALRELERVFK